MTLLLHRDPAQAMQKVFLGDVYQVEVDRKGADHLGDGVRAQALDQFHQAIAFDFAVAFAQLDEPGAQRLDRVKHLGALVLQQHVADQLAQQLDA